jgi:nucleoside-diphosphate-sugar epimerase
MIVYITGIKGVIGSALERLHVLNNDTVHGCDIEPSLYPNIDIRDPKALREDLHRIKPDRVYHCAAMLGVENTELYPELCNDINIHGTASVVDACNSVGVPELVLLSSSEVYGKVSGIPHFSENSRLLGNNVYARGKVINELQVIYKFKGKAVITRMFNCYGLNQAKQFFIPKIITAAVEGRVLELFGDGNNIRSYLYSQDAAQYIKDVADNAENGSIVNVASTSAITLFDVASLVKKLTHSSSEVVVKTDNYTDRKVERDIPNRLADTRRLRGLSTHVPMSLAEGIGHVITGYSTLKDNWSYDRKKRYYV